MPKTPAYLQPQTAIIPFRGGVDLKSDEKVVDPLKLLELENASFAEPGMIQHDNGYDAIVATARAVDRMLGNSTLRIAAAGPIVSSVYAGSAQAAVYADPSQMSCATAAEVVEEFALGDEGNADVDYAYANGFELMVASAGAVLVVYVVRERATKTVAFSGAITGNDQPARACAVGNTLVLIHTDGANVIMRTFDAPGSSAGPTNIATDALANTHIDVVAGASHFYVAYRTTAGNVIKVLKVAANFTVAASQTHSGTADRALTIGLESTTENVLLAWCHSSSGVRVAGFNSSLVAQSNSIIAASSTDCTRIGVSDCETVASEAIVFYEDQTAAADEPHVRRRTCPFSGASPSATERTIPGVRLAHKPILHKGLVLFGLSRSEGITATAVENWYCTSACWATDDEQVGPVGWYLYQVANPDLSRNHLPSIVVDGSELRWLGQERTQVADLDTVKDYFARSTVLTLLPWADQAAPYSSLIAMASGAGFSGGGLARMLAEDMYFWHAPEIKAVTWSAGGSMAASTAYQFVAVYEAELSTGERVQSIPSRPFLSSSGVGETQAVVEVTIPWRRAPAPGDARARMRLYRSLGGVLSGGPFYACEVQSIGDRMSYTDSVLFEDVLEADATIESRGTLYTDSGVLPNYPPPMGRVLAVHQDRLWKIDEHTGEIAFTKELVPGDAPAWHPNLVVSSRSDNIDPKALVSSSQGLWVLGLDRGSGKGAIGLVVGDGPNDHGNGGSYSLQRLDGCDVGTSNYRSVVVIPGGALFEDSQLGIHLLPAGGGPPQFVGAEIEDKRAGQTLVNAHVLEDRKEARYVMSSGRQLVYHYDVGQWSVRETQLGTATIGDSACWGKKQVLGLRLADGSGYVYQHSASAWRDAGTYAPLKISTAWVRMADFSGLKRVWELFLLGKHYDPHGLTVRLYYDFDDTAYDEYTFSESDIASVAASKKYQLKIEPRRQVCEAIRMTIIDASVASTTNGRGYAITALRMHYGVTGRGARKPSYAVAG